MSHLHLKPGDPLPPGGLGQYFVERKDVALALLAAVFLWGAVSFLQLGQRESPLVPPRSAQVIASFPGASPEEVERLVTREIERHVGEIDSIDKIISESRSGLALVQLVLRQSVAVRDMEGEWSKVRAKLAEVNTPAGAAPPLLDTTFRDTVTLLLSLESPALANEARAAQVERLRSILDQPPPGMRGSLLHAVWWAPGDFTAAMRERVAKAWDEEMVRSGAASHLRFTGELAVLTLSANPSVAARVSAAFRTAQERMLAPADQLHPDAVPLFLGSTADEINQAITAAEVPALSLRQLDDAARRLEDVVRDVRLVSRVQRIAAPASAVVIEVSQHEAAARGVRIEGLLNTLRVRNEVLPSGLGPGGPVDLPIGYSSAFANESEVAQAFFSNTEGATVNASDLIDVRRTYAEPLPGLATIHVRGTSSGRMRATRAVLLAIEMGKGGRISEFDTQVSAAIEHGRRALPEGVTVRRISDLPATVHESVRLVEKVFIEAVLVVLLVCVLLMDWRSAVLVATSIPLVMAFTVGGMKLLGITFDQVSALALIIALGVLVDDPVVAADGINREMAKGFPRPVASWLGPYLLRRPILFGTLINIFAFLPLALMPGDAGAFLISVPIVLGFALVGSRLASMTLIPWLGQYLLVGQKGFESGGDVRKTPPFSWIDIGLQRFMPRYRRALELGLRRPGWVLGVGYGLLVASFGLTAFFGTLFLPYADTDTFVVDIEQPPLTSRKSTAELAEFVRERIERDPRATLMAVFVGGGPPQFHSSFEPKEDAPHVAQILVRASSKELLPGLVDTLQEDLDKNVPNARIVVRRIWAGGGGQAPIQVRVRGDDLDQLKPLADQVAAILRSAGGRKVYDNLGGAHPALRLQIDELRAAQLGVSGPNIARAAQLVLTGVPATEIREKDRLTPVLLKLRGDEASRTEQFDELLIDSTAGLVPLAEVAKLEIEARRPILSRYNQRPTITVFSHTAQDELPSDVISRAKPEISRLQLPPGVDIAFGGDDELTSELAGDMGIVAVISLALICVTMIVQFASVTKALAVMVTVPLGLIGAFFGLAVHHDPLDFLGMMAVVSLAGVIVSHIIVLSDFVEDARESGMPIEEALVQAGLVRLRPVLVTVLATVGGLIPLKLSGGALWASLSSVHYETTITPTR